MDRAFGREGRFLFFYLEIDFQTLQPLHTPRKLLIGISFGGFFGIGGDCYSNSVSSCS